MTRTRLKRPRRKWEMESVERAGIQEEWKFGERKLASSLFKTLLIPYIFAQ